MAFIYRDNEIVPVPIPIGKRVKIGCNYRPPLENHISPDQLWIQDIFTFRSIPYYAIRFRFEKYVVLFTIWLSVVYILTMIGRYWLGSPN